MPQSWLWDAVRLIDVLLWDMSQSARLLAESHTPSPLTHVQKKHDHPDWSLKPDA
jgi:hypothetical protein